MEEGITGLLLAMGVVKQPTHDEKGGGAASAASKQPLEPCDPAPSLRRSSRKRVPSWDDDPVEDSRGKKDLPAEAAAVLKVWTLDHFENPYPTHEVRPPRACAFFAVPSHARTPVPPTMPFRHRSTHMHCTRLEREMTWPRFLTRHLPPTGARSHPATAGKEDARRTDQDPDETAGELVHQHAQAHLETATAAAHPHVPLGR